MSGRGIVLCNNVKNKGIKQPVKYHHYFEGRSLTGKIRKKERLGRTELGKYLCTEINKKKIKSF